MNLASVQIIGTECIACATLVGSDHFVLVHSKLGMMGGRAVEVTVRSKELRLTDAVHRQLVEVLPK